MKKFRAVEMFDNLLDAEEIMKKIENNEKSSIAICCYDNQYKKHFTSIIYKNNEYYLLDSLQHSESKILKSEVKKRLQNSLMKNTRILVLAQV